jgi:hypothetical protein
MHKLILAAALLVAPVLSAHVPQQSGDREAVRRAALDYLEGFYEGDSTKLKKSGRVRPATDPKEVLIYEVLDQTASVKVTAYWGIDYLLLARHDGKWMISHVLWQTPPKKA